MMARDTEACVLFKKKSFTLLSFSLSVSASAMYVGTELLLHDATARFLVHYRLTLSDWEARAVVSECMMRVSV
jgi:hypothetical protein